MASCWMVSIEEQTFFYMFFVVVSWLIVTLKIFCFLQGFFIRPFYKMMLQKLITLHDMESVVGLSHAPESGGFNSQWLFAELT